MGQATPLTAPGGGGRRARGQATRAALVDAALRLFGEKGVEHTSVDEITAAAAVAKGTFYVHFQRKQDVLLERAAQLVLEAAGRLPAGGDAATDLVRFGERLARLISDEPRSVMGRIVREIVGNREDWLRVLGDRPSLSAVIQPVVERGQVAGQLRVDQTPAQLSQALTILLLDNLIGWAERPEERPLARDLARATALFLDGAAART